MKISPEFERIYRQLQWGESRRFRIISSVSSHFGKEHTQGILAAENISPSFFTENMEFQDSLDRMNLRTSLQNIAFEQECLEAATVTALRKHASVYQNHVDEQILFGARTAGQDAGRAFLAKTKDNPTQNHLDVPEAVQAVFELTFNGMPWERNHFICLRSMGSSTVHFARSAHLLAWKRSEADPKFLYLVKIEWIRGILDILSPQTEVFSSQSIEQGADFGLVHFLKKGLHASP